MKEDKKRMIIAVVSVSLAFAAADAIFICRDSLAHCLFPDIVMPSICLMALFHRSPLEFRKDCVQLTLIAVTLVSMLPFWPVCAYGVPLKAAAGPALAALLMLSESVSMDIRRYAKVSRLFRNEAIWHNVLKDSKSFYFTLAMIAIAMHYLSFGHGAGLSLLSVSALIMALGLLGVSIARLLTGRTLYMTSSREDELKSLLRGNLRTREVAEGVKERKMKALYKKILDYFEEKKPYLDEDVSLEDISRCLYTNKAYLSKTVNVLSGQNFRQFVNYYRVEYAVELIRRDPHLKVEELAMMSGFHNTVSFNMAFRLFKGTTPSEWIHEHRSTLR